MNTKGKKKKSFSLQNHLILVESSLPYKMVGTSKPSVVWAVAAESEGSTMYDGQGALPRQAAIAWESATNLSRSLGSASTVLTAFPSVLGTGSGQKKQNALLERLRGYGRKQRQKACWDVRLPSEGPREG